MKEKLWIWWNALAKDETERWAVARAGEHVLATYYREVEINVPSRTLVTPGGRGVIETEGVTSLRIERVPQGSHPSHETIVIRELVVSAENARPRCEECGGDLGGHLIGRIENHRENCSRFPL